MNPERWAELKQLFDAARALPHEERSAFVGGLDPETRDSLQELLAADDEAGSFLEPDAAAAASQPMSWNGTRVGAYQVGERIGSGGMADVYSARDTQLDREVAIKVMQVDDPISGGRLLREARHASSLNHPHICTIHHVGEEGGRPYVVMERIDGRPLLDLVPPRGLPVGMALRYAAQIADALSHAHAHDVVHRDLTARNVMVTSQGQVKVLDFGLARSVQVARAEDRITLPGFLVGTPGCIAPEVLRGETADGRGDIFALGVVLHGMVSGEPPFAGTSPIEINSSVLRDPPRSLPPAVPAVVTAIVRRCLAKEPNDRYQTAAEVRAAIEAAQVALETTNESAAPPKGRRGGLRVHVAWLAVLLAGLALIAPRLYRPVPQRNAVPVVVLMDSPLPDRIYDPRTAASGGTNADDLTDALRDLPVRIEKENTSAFWHREQQVLLANPDLIVSHLSCLLDTRPAAGGEEMADHLFDLSTARLAQFFAYVAAVNPNTKFLVYSRRAFEDTRYATWRDEVVARFPVLRGRVEVFSVAHGDAELAVLGLGKVPASFRDPRTARDVRSRIEAMLARR
jgi:serine/threonine protein kinase